MEGRLDGQTDACSGSLPTRVLAGRTSLCRPLSPRQPAQALLTTPGVQRGWWLQLQHPGVLHVPREGCCTQVPGGASPAQAMAGSGTCSWGMPHCCSPHFPSPPAQHPPSTPSLLPRFTTAPQNGGNWLGATFNPVPSAFPSHSPMRTVAPARPVAPSWALGRLMELPGSGRLAPASIIYKAGRVSHWQPGGSLGGGDCAHTHPCTHTHTHPLIPPCSEGDKCRKRGR